MLLWYTNYGVRHTYSIWAYKGQQHTMVLEIEKLVPHFDMETDPLMNDASVRIFSPAK